MKINKVIILVLLVVIVCSFVLTGCLDTTTEYQAKQEIAQSQAKKSISVAELIKTVGPPVLTYSNERENIAKRIEVTNNRNLIGWIYLFETGRVVGRFPVKGKVSSGTKRLTSTQGYVYDAEHSDYVGEQPDEMAAYGPSVEYIFWFDPAGNYHQFKGNYFYSTKPYQINLGSITMEIDNYEVLRYKEGK